MDQEFIAFMHDDTTSYEREDDWEPYHTSLRTSGRLRGGSAIGSGRCYRRGGNAPPVAAHITGFLRINAESLDAVERMLAGNPVYEATIDLSSGGGAGARHARLRPRHSARVRPVGAGCRPRPGRTRNGSHRQGRGPEGAAALLLLRPGLLEAALLRAGRFEDVPAIDGRA